MRHGTVPLHLTSRSARVTKESSKRMRLSDATKQALNEQRNILFYGGGNKNYQLGTRDLYIIEP